TAREGCSRVTPTAREDGCQRPDRSPRATNKPGNSPGRFIPSRRRKIGQRKTGNTLVLLRQRAQLVLGDEVVEIGERAVAGELLDPDVDEIRRVLAVGAHDFRGGLAPRRL